MESSAGTALPEINELNFNQIHTTKATLIPADIKEQMIYQRAVEAAIWGLPAVNYQLMFDELVKIKGNFNQVVIWPGLLDWKNQTLTPNQDVIYSMAFFNTKDVGPVVLEIPPADSGIVNGSIMDYWQAAIEDVGPGGVDKGKGGKYLFLPPGYDKSKIPNDYIPMQSQTYQGYTLMRSIPKSNSDEDIRQAVSYSRHIRVYPLSEASNPKETTYIDASNSVYDSTIPKHRYWKRQQIQSFRQEPGFTEQCCKAGKSKAGSQLRIYAAVL